MTSEKTSNAESSASFSIPWKKVARLGLLHSLHYLLRSVSWEIWRASRTLDVEFDELKFGETPVRTAQEILRAVPGVTANSVVADLGCGRGRAAFYFHLLSGAKVVAYDIVESYIATARALARKMECENEVLFYLEDLRSVELAEFDVIYACALCFGEPTRELLLEKLLKATPGVHIVTVGWQPRHERLEPIATFPATFSWGRAGVSVVKLR